MSTVNLSDAQLDEAAQRYAMAHRVNYAEALRTVADMASFSEPDSTQRPSADASGEVSDAQVHSEALAFQLANRVGYVDALRAVVDARNANFARGAAVVRANFSDDSDKQLHARAEAYAASKGVSYSEALHAVAPVQMNAAALGQQANDSGDSDMRLLDQEAQAFATANGVNYSEALFAVSAGMAKTQAQKALESQPIEIFRSGTHVDTVGVSREFTVDDVKAMAGGCPEFCV